MPTTLFRRAWYPPNRLCLQALIKHARSAEACAAFDWDNTCIFGDIGDTSFRYALDHLLMRPTPQALDAMLPRRVNGRALLSDGTRLADLAEDIVQSYQSLATAHPPTRKNKTQRHPLLESAAHQDFRAKLYWLYEAVASEPKEGPLVAYRLQVLTWSGLQEVDVYRAAQSAVQAALASPARQTCWVTQTPGRVGARQAHFHSFLRPLAEMQELVGTLAARGILPYVISASFEPLVKACAKVLGYAVPASHIFGMRLESQADFYLPKMLPNWPATYREGKVACIERCLPEAPLLVAGDHLTDFEMLTRFAATRLRLVIDRGLEVPEMAQLYRTALSEEPSDQRRVPAHQVTLLQGRDESQGTFCVSQRSKLLKNKVPLRASKTPRNLPGGEHQNREQDD